MDILSLFEYLSFENLIDNLPIIYKKEKSEEMVTKLKNSILKKISNNGLFTKKDFGAAVRKFITRNLIGNMQVTEQNENRDLLFELSRIDLWKENISNSEKLEEFLENLFSECKLNIGQAYALYELIGDEDKDELKNLI